MQRRTSVHTNKYLLVIMSTFAVISRASILRGSINGIQEVEWLKNKGVWSASIEHELSINSQRLSDGVDPILNFTEYVVFFK